jgi:LmbE family N-acetylglucosaminyl deacetylase
VGRTRLRGRRPPGRAGNGGVVHGSDHDTSTRPGLGYPDGVDFERALVAFAHPDDAEFLCGGTVALWASEGTRVTYVCATDGSAGWNGPDRRREEIARIREREMEQVGELLGVEEIRFLGYPDGSLEPTLALRRDLTREVRRARPEVIVTFDPSELWSGRSYINHPDHRAVGEAVLAVVACDAPTRPQFPELLVEGFEPHKVKHLWLSTSSGADRLVDIGETIDLKIKALALHESQMENMGRFDADERLRRWARKTAGDADFEYAEAFRTFEIEV